MPCSEEGTAVADEGIHRKELLSSVPIWVFTSLSVAQTADVNKVRHWNASGPNGV